MRLPGTSKELVEFALRTIEICRSDQGNRAAAYRQYGQWLETGRQNGGLALANTLYHHVDNLASHLYSPTDLNWAISFRWRYSKEILKKAEIVARLIGEEWELKDIDQLIGDAVFEALTYGASVVKLVTDKGDDEDGGDQDLDGYLVSPWNFGVYNPSENDLERQDAVCETTYLTRSQVWWRIRNLPDAEKLYKRIMAQGDKNSGVGVPSNFMHQVLSTAVLNPSLTESSAPTPGGIVNISNDPNFTNLGPQMGTDLFPMHELWVKDDAKGGDYTTIQMVEPDILICPAPGLARKNIFCPRTLPYGLIQPNVVRGYVWGRSELVDLMELQKMLSTHLDDIKRIFGQQFDKLLAFMGGDGIDDELYSQFRSQGFVNLGPGGDVKDLTPAMPANSLEFVEMILSLMERVSGFSNIMSGRGDSGVRAGNHADMLMRTASPRLRDRSLRVERQVAKLGDKTLSVMRAKDGKVYWPDADLGEEQDFTLHDIPDDARVTVDGHSSSPIFHDDHQQLVAFGVKSGFIDGESAIRSLPYPNKDLLIELYREAQKAKAKLIEEHPEILTHQKPGGKK